MTPRHWTSTAWHFKGMQCLLHLQCQAVWEEQPGEKRGRSSEERTHTYIIYNIFIHNFSSQNAGPRWQRAPYSLKMSWNTQPVTKCHNPQNFKLQQDCYNNLRTYITVSKYITNAFEKASLNLYATVHPTYTTQVLPPPNNHIYI